MMPACWAHLCGPGCHRACVVCRRAWVVWAGFVCCGLFVWYFMISCCGDACLLCPNACCMAQATAQVYCYVPDGQIWKWPATLACDGQTATFLPRTCHVAHIACLCMAWKCSTSAQLAIQTQHVVFVRPCGCCCRLPCVDLVLTSL
jgi:hypothetical protein